MKPLRVLQFITPSGFYGAERWVLALANNLDPKEIVCDLAVTEESPNQDLSIAEHYPHNLGEVHRIRMNGRFDLRAIHRLARTLKEREIDVVHTHGYKSDIIGLIAARSAGIKCVSTPHGFSGKVGLKLATFIRIGTWVLKFFDAVAPLSEELVADMRRFQVPEKKLYLIRNGVDLLEIDKEAPAHFSEAEEFSSGAGSEKVVGFVGQLIPRKGVADLIDVFDRLFREDPSLRLRLLGDGSERGALERRAMALDSANAINFMGFRTDRLRVLSQFDLFVMTSSLEGIPRCMMEAMAMGVPVAAYDIPGVDQLIENNVTGLMVPFGDKRALELACRKLLEDRVLAKKLAQAARERIYDRYSANRMAQEYVALFENLRAGNGRSVLGSSQ
ncbi:glycosyltransferase [Marinobacter koreensis]|uniref:Glycosyltransferase n=1 Tax=Marinobacter koreensis TaxID=335974 RepID=A0ABW0RGV8_9GAMM|nr:glycosyltransferase [Marinobacter koreensis]MCK7548611.1 glycosyltransferase [Marinobacter koreensis]